MALRVRTIRSIALAVMHIANVDIMEPFSERDGAGTGQRLVRRRRHIHYPVARMECGEVQRHVRPQMLAYPRAFGVQLGIVIVETGDEQRGELHPHVFAFWGACLVDCIVNGREHVGQMCAGHFPIEIFGEAFEVDIGGVHGGVEVGPGQVRFAGTESALPPHVPAHGWGH